MRKSIISKDILLSLQNGHFDEAVNTFIRTCEEADSCENIKSCVDRCFIPKLRYMALSRRNPEFDNFAEYLAKNISKIRLFYIILG